MKMTSLASFLSLLFFISCAGTGGDDVIPGDDLTLTCSTEQIEVPATGGEYTLNVNCSRGEWTAFAEDDCSSWVKVKVSGSTSTQGTVMLNVAPNKETDYRGGSVVIRSGTKRVYVSVKQDMPLQVEKNTVYSVSKGETLLVKVKAAGEWSVRSNDSWITAKKAEGEVEITTAVNVDMAQRIGSVTVISGEEKVPVSVVQNSAEDTDINTPEGYYLVWHDEFNVGTTLDSDWTHEVQRSGWVNNELQNYVNGYSPEGVPVTELKDGRLRIRCFKENGKIYSGRVYAKVKEGWKYGYIEASIKLPKGRGTWPAFWMMPVHFTSWPADGEIDIMEEVGANPNYVSSSLHANSHVHSNGTQVTHEMYCEGAESEFHTYAIEWTADNITTYVDGKVQLSYDNRGLGRDDWPYDAPFYVILNLAWGGDWGGYKGVDESALPAIMEVDYVRVFQKK